MVPNSNSYSNIIVSDENKILSMEFGAFLSFIDTLLYHFQNRYILAQMWETSNSNGLVVQTERRNSQVESLKNIIQKEFVEVI